MKKMLFLFAAFASASGLFAEIQEKDLFFKMDFDNPLKVGSEYLDVALPKSGLADGKFGKGFYFQRKSHNFLPEKAAAPGSMEFFKANPDTKLALEADGNDSLLSASGTGFAVISAPVVLTGNKIIYFHPVTAVTGSCHVKGPKGTKLSFSVQFTAQKPSEKEIAAWITAGAKNKLVKQPPEYQDRLRDDKSVPQSIVLTGEWQRVAAYAECDVRAAVNRSASINVSITGPDTEKVYFKQFQLEHTMFSPHLNLAPTSWLPGQSSRFDAETGFEFILPSIQNHFPAREGTLCFWWRAPADTALQAQTGDFFAFFKAKNQPMWTAGAYGIETGSGVKGYLPDFASRSEKWTHFALVWNENQLSAYVNGVRKIVSKRTFKALEDPGKYVLQIGRGFPNNFPANALMDEVMIFNRSLTDSEIQGLAKAETPLKTGMDASFRIAPFGFKPFFRNDPAAGVTLDVFSDKARETVFELKSFQKNTLHVSLEKGWNTVKIPFEPALKSPGKGSLKLTVSDSDGKILYEKQDVYEVRGQLRRDQVKCFSWGSEREVPLDYEVKMGFNTVTRGSQRTADDLLEKNLFINLDIRNHRALASNNFDVARTVTETRPAVLLLRDSFNWYATLLNTETAGAWPFHQWKTLPFLLKDAEKRFGPNPPVDRVRILPDMCFLPDPEISFDTDGVFTPGRTFQLLKWYRNEGDMIIALNRETGKLVHSAAPDNLLWTEPDYPIGFFNGVGMGAAWAYGTTLQENAGTLRNAWGHFDGSGKFFMPTLTMYYWVNGPLSAELNGKKYSLPRTLEALVADCWAAVSAAPFHDLNFFNTYAWYDAENKAEAYLPMKGMSDAFGRFMKQDFYEAALLLRDTGEPRAKVALLVPEQISYYSENDWNYDRVKRMWLRTLSLHNVHYDVLYDANLEKKKLSDYHTIIVPMRSKAALAVHDALTEAGRAGSKIVVDDACPAKYPDMLKLPYKWTGSFDQDLFKVCEDFVRELSTGNTGRSVRANGDKGPVMFFERLHNGRRYVVVINNHWRTGYLGEHAANKMSQGIEFKPHGVPQNATVSIAAEPDGKTVVYDFLKSSRISSRTNSGRIEFNVPLEPGEGRVFCIYPEPLGKLNVSLDAPPCPGKTAVLKVTQKTASGRFPGGRQILHVDIRDGNNKPTDESGLYGMENGTAEIPLRFAFDSASGKWTASVSERSSGERAVFTFHFPKEKNAE